MKRAMIFLFVGIIALMSVISAWADTIGTLVCIGMTEDDVKQWTSDIAFYEGKDIPYDNPHRIVFFDDLNSMVLALKSGKIDRLSIGMMTAQYIADRNDDLSVSDRQHQAVLGYSIAMLDKNSEIIDAMNAHIKSMKEDGTIDVLKTKYIDQLGTSDPEPVAMPETGSKTIRIAVTGDLPPFDLLLSDGTPAGFNTAFLAELSNRMDVRFELVNISSSARAIALSSGEVDALFWTRSTYDADGNELPFPLDRIDNISITIPYLIDNRDAVQRNE